MRLIDYGYSMTCIRQDRFLGHTPGYIIKFYHHTNFMKEIHVAADEVETLEQEFPKYRLIK